MIKPRSFNLTWILVDFIVCPQLHSNFRVTNQSIKWLWWFIFIRLWLERSIKWSHLAFFLHWVIIHFHWCHFACDASLTLFETNFSGVFTSLFCINCQILPVLVSKVVCIDTYTFELLWNNRWGSWHDSMLLCASTSCRLRIDILVSIWCVAHKTIRLYLYVIIFWIELMPFVDTLVLPKHISIHSRVCIEILLRWLIPLHIIWFILMFYFQLVSNVIIVKCIQNISPLLIYLFWA